MNTEAISTEPVESSNIAALGFDWKGATLAVVFKKGGKIYHYAPVPKPLFEGLRKARSIGGYFAAHIRNSPSITAYLFCDCGQFFLEGTHAETCISVTRESYKTQPPSPEIKAND